MGGCFGMFEAAVFFLKKIDPAPNLQNRYCVNGVSFANAIHFQTDYLHSQ